MSHPDEENEAMGYPSPMIWTTLDKRRIPIPKMEDSHLLNVIAYLRRRAPGHHMSEKERVAAIDLHFSLARIAAGKEIDIGDDGEEHDAAVGVDYEAYLKERSPQYPNLLAEAAKRGLQVPDSDWSEENVSVLLAEYTLATFAKRQT